MEEYKLIADHLTYSYGKGSGRERNGETKEIDFYGIEAKLSL